MKVGDIIINPYVSQEYQYQRKPNPLYKTMVIHIGTEYTTCLRIDGKRVKYYTKDAKKYEVVGHIDIAKLILGEESTDADSN